MTTREDWVALLEKIATPVFANASPKPVGYVPMEAIARSLASVGPWIASTGLTGTEETKRAAMAILARNSVINNLDPVYNPPFPATISVVDCAFLCLGMLRCKPQTWDQFGPVTRSRITTAIINARHAPPLPLNNWVLFYAINEAFMAYCGLAHQTAPITTAFNAYSTFYAGDGAYGDGVDYQHDYYASYVAYPFLIAILDAMLAAGNSTWESNRTNIILRARRYAQVQERSIAQDGSFSFVGRSISYRGGAFHHLADMARRQMLEGPRVGDPALPPAQVRCALTAMLNKTLTAPNTFAAGDFLNIGLCGNQESIEESYISGSSLYMATLPLIALGLPPTAPFWADADVDWTWKKVWNGVDMPPDHAY